VPLAVVVVTLFPMVFILLAESMHDLSERLLVMARLYHVPRGRVVRDLILPGIRPAMVAALSYGLGITWKVIATAEFLGSESGIGARLYWAYRNLDMAALFAWAVVIVAVGTGIQVSVVRPLRRNVNGEAGG
jgi:ABC-type nitrate/sulfonate/bicarbonate transport system permease component